MATRTNAARWKEDCGITPWKEGAMDFYPAVPGEDGRAVGEGAYRFQKGLLQRRMSGKFDIDPDEVRQIGLADVSDNCGGQNKDIGAKAKTEVRMGASFDVNTHMSAGRDYIVEYNILARKTHSTQYMPVDDAIMLSIRGGDISLSQVMNLPGDLASKMLDLWSPAVTMNYAMMVLTSPYGYLELLRHELPLAFLFSKVHAFRLHYNINWNYLVNRCKVNS